jgi:uncharacterized FAD-dependent dehydrogenase
MIRVRQIKISVMCDNISDVVYAACRKACVNVSDVIDYKINRKSIDARHKDSVCFIYEIDLNLKKGCKVKFSNDVVFIDSVNYSFSCTGSVKLSSRPVVVGSGPCGLFCAYELALNGFKPIVLERGESMENRINSVNNFWKTNDLNVNSNVQFGEGGAGTFSDGKLSTQIKDRNNRIDEVLNTFVSFGAPNEILYDYMPHIGTDRLRDVVCNMRNKIISLGGEFRYNSCLTDINVVDGRISSIVVNDDLVIPCDVLVLAIGHSARDTFRMLYSHGISMSSKPFAVGLRVMHSQDLISFNQFGSAYSFLRPASYKLTYNSSNGRGVYSFCMCPGGYVVNASSESGRLVVNGMSNYARESGVANSAIVVTVNSSDFGDDVFSGVRFQEELESRAYELGNGLIPIQKFGDFCEGVESIDFDNFVLKGGYRSALLSDLFSDSIKSSFIEGMNFFGGKIKGFNDSSVVLAGVESRTSSPIRMYRDDDFVSNIDGIYPAGEGAGYAGGIVSSAVDGIKVFESIVSKFYVE